MAPVGRDNDTRVSSGLAPGASEFVHLAGPVGILALHGGRIEPGTEAIARFVARESRASLYVYAGLLPRGNLRLHRPSHSAASEMSPLLRQFLDHVRLAISIHGHSRNNDCIFLGGLNETMGRTLAAAGGSALPRYRWITDREEIPRKLRGRHPRNAVNLPRDHGVQLELPPPLRQVRSHSEGGLVEPVGDALTVSRVILELVHTLMASYGEAP
jgi:phage replication-related protein YjqB (UPF0714/DUF867 family)